MKTTRVQRLISFLLALMMVATMMCGLTVNASAAQTANTRIISNVYQGSGNGYTKFIIKGNLLSRKEVRIDVFLSLGQQLTFPKANSWYQKNARFHVLVAYPDGKMYQAYVLKHGDTFKLPWGAKNYRVSVYAYLSGSAYEYNHTYNTFAPYAVYNLKY